MYITKVAALKTLELHHYTVYSNFKTFQEREAWNEEKRMSNRNMMSIYFVDHFIIVQKTFRRVVSFFVFFKILAT